MGFDPLLILIGLPAFAGAVSLLVPDRARGYHRLSLLVVTAAVFVQSILVFAKGAHRWPVPGEAILRLDALAGLVALGIGLFGFLVALYSSASIDRYFGKYVSYFLITLGASYAVAFANHLVLLLVAWGILAITLFLLVGIDGSPGSRRAAQKALLIVGATDGLMLFGIGLIWHLTGSFSMENARIALGSVSAFAAFLSLAAAAFAKAGAMPFHSWVPDVAETAPVPVTAFLPASLDKLLGIYLLARIAIGIFEMNRAANLLLCAVGAVTIVVAVLLALVQHDLKKLLGYHAVSQVGYMVLGIGTGTAAGIVGGLFHMFNHAVYKSCLFLSGGVVEKAAGTTDLGKLGGLAGKIPFTFVAFLVASLAISGIPPLNGFVSKWMIYQGIIDAGRGSDRLWFIWLIAAMFGSTLTVASFMKLIHAIFLARPHESQKAPRVYREGYRMVIPLVVLAAICIFFGIFAFVFPLPRLVIPASGVEVLYTGSWSPIAATLLLGGGIVLGFAVYAFGRAQPVRVVDPFVGGEKVEGFTPVSGVDFYNTVKEAPLLKGFYARASSGGFDPYEALKRTVVAFSRPLERLHNGVLPTYLVWALLGVLAMLIFMFLRVP